MQIKTLKNLLKYKYSLAEIGEAHGVTDNAVLWHKQHNLTKKDLEDIKTWRKKEMEKIMKKNMEETLLLGKFE